MKSKLTMQEHLTTLGADEVLARAEEYFAERSNLYAAYRDREGPGFRTFRGQGGEEIVIAAMAAADGTLVTGSSYLFDMQVARFLTTLPPAEARPGSARAGIAGEPAGPAT